MILIGFGNKARQGKDLAVESIVSHYSNLRAIQLKYELKLTALVTQRVGFADALYEECREKYGMTEKDAPLLQRVGALRREEDPEYWIKTAFAKFSSSTDVGLISDVRYQNEANFIKAQGGYVVNVTRKRADGSNFFATDRPLDHPSEIDLDNYGFDFYLVNSEGHQALLAEQAITLVEYLRGIQF